MHKDSVLGWFNGAGGGQRDHWALGGRKQEAEGHIKHKSASESVQELKPSLGSLGSTAQK